MRKIINLKYRKSIHASNLPFLSPYHHPTPLPPLAKQHVANEHPSFSYTYLKTSLDLVQFDKKRRIFLELNSKGLHRSSGKEKETVLSVFMSSTKRENRKFHVVVTQRQQRNVQKSVIHVHSCCFANLTISLFCRSRCRRRRRHRCLTSLITADDARKIKLFLKRNYFFSIQSLSHSSNGVSQCCS